MMRMDITIMLTPPMVMTTTRIRTATARSFPMNRQP